MKKLKILLKSRKLIYILLLIFFARFGLFIMQNKSKLNINNTNFTCTIINIKKEQLLLNCNEYLIAYIDDKSNLEIGNIIKVNGKLERIDSNTNFNLFNYKEYQNNNNIFYKLYINKYKKIGSANDMFLNIKNNIIKRINKLKSHSYLRVFILGEKNEIDSNVLSKYKQCGIIHLFSISGMHISFLVDIFNKLFRKNNLKRDCFGIGFLLFYYKLIESISLLRCIIHLLIKKVNLILDIKIDKKLLLFIELLIILIIKPNAIYNIGFYYSFIISSTLSIMSYKITKTKNNFLKTFYISFISFLVSLPLNLYSYSEINILSIINNMICVPFVSFIVFPLSVLTLIFTYLDKLLFYLILFFEQLTNILSNWNIILIFHKPSIIVIIFYYISIFLLLYNKRIYLPILVILIIHYNYNFIFREKYVMVLDVSQGDSILYHNSNTNILVDTGGIYKRDIVDNITIPILKSLGIRKLDYLIITHGDFDHMGEAINLVNNFKVEKVIFNCGPYNDLEKGLIKVLDKKKIKYYSCIKELNIDKNKLYFLQTKVYDNENDNSNVIITELDSYKFMFMGDASTITEKEIMSKYNLPDIDVLKVGHHGSRTSSDKEFIDEINPNYSIISVGKNNRYGHPNKEVLDNLKKSKIYRTDQDGSIMFKIKNNKLKIETCNQ